MSFVHLALGRFWEIERHHRLIVVRHGAVGKKGKEIRLGWSEARIQEEIAQRIQAKLTEGYVSEGEAEPHIESLMAQLREDPGNADLALVLADVWSSTGDLRGERIVLQHALSQTVDPHKATRLEARLLELLREHKSDWMTLPGGWPFREQWVGRNYFEYGWYREPKWSPLKTYRVIRQFMERFTTSMAPMEVFASRLSRSHWTHAQDELPPADRAFCKALAEADVLANWDRSKSTWTRFAPAKRSEYAAFDKALAAAWALDPTAHFQLRWYTQITNPDSPAQLPFHNGEFYTDGKPLQSHIRIRLDEPLYEFTLRFPFQDPANPQFAALRGEMEELLEHRFLSTKWRKFIPAKGRHTMKRRKFRI